MVKLAYLLIKYTNSGVKKLKFSFLELLVTFQLLCMSLKTILKILPLYALICISMVYICIPTNVIL